MSGFSGSPRLVKGALVVMEGQQSVKQVILFQYNPETLTRSLQSRNQYDENKARSGEPLGLRCPPQETISLEIELDATEQMEKAVPGVPALGVYPALSALEALLYPPSEQVLVEESLLELGQLEISLPRMPLVLFAWGQRRVLPVSISSLSITEQAFDPDLNPILAKVSLSMNVLTYDDLGGITTAGGALYLAHHIAVETLSSIYTASSAAAIAASTLQQGITGIKG